VCAYYWHRDHGVVVVVADLSHEPKKFSGDERTTDSSVSDSLERTITLSCVKRGSVEMTALKDQLLETLGVPIDRDDPDQMIETVF